MPKSSLSHLGIVDATRTARAVARRSFGALLVGVVAATAALGSGTATAKTTVKEKNGVVTITLPVDCVGCGDWTAPTDGSDLAKYWEALAEKAWNSAFDRFSYCNKYKLKLDVKIKSRPSDFGASAFGRHQLVVTTPDGHGWKGAGWGGAPEQTPGGPAGQRAPDGTRYYEFDAEGTMPADATPTVVIHEFGHLLGLGDDRDGTGNAVPNREGTIMVGGATGVTPNTKLRIDKALIDRIGEQLANMGAITCGARFQGSVESTTTSSRCTGTESGTITLVAVGERATGSIEASGSYTCEGVTVPTSGGIHYVGTFKHDRFKLPADGISGLLLSTANCGVASILEIKVRHDVGNVSPSFTAPSGDTYSCTIEIERQDEGVS